RCRILLAHPLTPVVGPTWNSEEPDTLPLSLPSPCWPPAAGPRRSTSAAGRADPRPPPGQRDPDAQPRLVVAGLAREFLAVRPAARAPNQGGRVIDPGTAQQVASLPFSARAASRAVRASSGTRRGRTRRRRCHSSSVSVTASEYQPVLPLR